MRIPPSNLLQTAVIAGIIAGLSLGVFQFFVAEPSIDRAIAIEEQRAAPNAMGHETFSRQTQKVGLIAAGVVYGLAYGLIFGGVFSYFRRSFPNLSTRTCVLLLALLAVWVIAVVPAIKYPANPPAVGDPDTAYFRQTIYLGLIIMNVLGFAVAEFLRLLLKRTLSQPWMSFGIAAAAYAAFLVVLLRVLPSTTPITTVPADLLNQFRTAALAGQVVFWCILGGTFAYLLRRQAVSRNSQARG